MKAITVRQPWASLLVLGVKTLDPRSWQTHHRGPLLIHAGRRLAPHAAQLWQVPTLAETLCRAGYPTLQSLPRGVLLGTVQLLACTRLEELALEDLSAQESLWCDPPPGCWLWHFRDAAPLRRFLPWRGRLGLFDVPDEHLLSLLR